MILTYAGNLFNFYCFILNIFVLVRSDSGQELEVIEKVPMTQWLVDNYKNFGATLEFVTNKSQEGAQFLRGFGGIGGLQRWASF